MKNTIINLVSGASLLLGVSTSVDIEKELLNKNNISIDLYQKNYYTNNMINENLIYNFANLTNLIEDGSKNKDAVENKVYIDDETFKIKMEEKRIQEELEKQLELERLAELERQKQIKLAEEKKKLEELNKKNKTYIYEVTFYTAGVESTGKTRNHPDYGKTASGTYVKEGRTIACPKNIPFGTKLYIEGFGERICEDRGGAIKAGKLDVYVDSLIKAKKLGRQKLKVTFIK